MTIRVDNVPANVRVIIQSFKNATWSQKVVIKKYVPGQDTPEEYIHEIQTDEHHNEKFAFIGRTDVDVSSDGAYFDVTHYFKRNGPEWIEAKQKITKGQFSPTFSASERLESRYGSAGSAGRSTQTQRKHHPHAAHDWVRIGADDYYESNGEYDNCITSFQWPSTSSK